MANRYIDIDDSVSQSFEAFVDAIRDTIIGKVNQMDKDGTLDILQIYSTLGYPQMKKGYGRMALDGVYEKEKQIRQMVEQGILRLESSSWGNIEKSDKDQADTQPGLEDMHPQSTGWNNFGGPTYTIYVSREGIQIDANFCHQDLGNSWDCSSGLDLVWQHRTFIFTPVVNNDETLKQMLMPFKIWIIDCLSNRMKKVILSDFINKTADTYLDKFIKEQGK